MRQPGAITLASTPPLDRAATAVCRHYNRFMAATNLRRSFLFAFLPTALACAQESTFRVPTSAMEPALLAGDRVSVQPASEYHRGDIVVFHATLDGTDVTLIKRLIGLPTDHLKFSDKVLILNSRAV